MKALVALCKREGDHKAVADQAKVSAANLWQIVAGIKLPSGHPRGVGPTLRAKITAAYPDWLAGNPDEKPIAAPISTARPNPSSTLELLGELLRNVPDHARESVSRKLAALALAPDSAQLMQSLISSFGIAPEPDGPARVKPEHQQALDDMSAEAEARHAREQQQQRRRLPGR